MDAIGVILDILRDYPQVQPEVRADGIVVRPASADGYEVALLLRPGGQYTVYMNGWHEEFDDEATAVGTFMSALTPEYRLRVSRRGDVDYKWTIYYRQGEEWIRGSTVGLLGFPIWRRKRVRYLQNHIIPKVPE